ncbi:MAG TPA: DEAD/DEAH box helicase [Chloroflexota bacterium]|nr:DEAD/DEAH box helicase [Chloroflexota bacterium]
MGELCSAVEEELEEVRASQAARAIAVFGGRCLGRGGEDWLYVFGLHFPITLPDDVPLRIDLPTGESYLGQLVSSTSFEVTVSCGVKLPEKLGAANLTVDSSFILEQLIARLTEIEEDDAGLALTLFGLKQPVVRGPVELPDDPEANEFQLQALQAVLERDVTYVWGPPGTGKTTALALIAAALVQRGLRVLAVASTNVAVDNAVLKIGERLGGATPVVRYGTPQLPGLRAEPGASGGRGTLMQTMPLPFLEVDGFTEGPLTVQRGGDPSLDAQDDMPANGRVVVLPTKRLPDQREEGERLRTLRQARVVGATLSRVALAPELLAPGFDAVLIDEASAAPLPAAFMVAALAGSKVVALGDPKQLPPVAQSNGPLSRRWLQRDVFEQAGLDDDDGRAVLLREQFRMPPDISRLANELVYGGRLIDAQRVRRIPGGARLVDTSAQGGVCERRDGSRLNQLHAELAVELAYQRLNDGDAGGSVAIVTPYRAQARLIWRMLRDRRLERLIESGTVHRFQGLEREAIIFDTVEAAPERPAPFVRNGYNSEAMRLINVAITRARSDLLVIADVEHLRRTLPRGSTLLGLIELLAEEW